MPKASEKFASDSRRRILIVDDELINRELLKLILEDDFDTFTAPDGETALELVHEHGESLSLILLDLLMPGMHGLEVIRHLKGDPDLRRIPIIVLTADSKAEVQSLKEGAVDFIAKPYPDREVILARVNRTIELTEDRETIRYTERDSLTGLYNREYFFRYCRQLDQLRPDAEMDAMIVDAHHFRMINERYGKAYGDDVLRHIGRRLREAVRDSGGIVCRREADTFLVYCPHREDYQSILDAASVGLSGDGGGRVRLRMGVYARVDRSIELERRFDRAKMAADTARSSYMSSFALYDNELHESEIYTERLLEDFQDAIEKKQFKVYYQPKFDIRPEIPELSSAEALVRWAHPELGFINPGKFIPLFEENGLIQQLDLYVWRETAAQLREWKERLGISVPVSVNVSRVDMYDSNLIETFEELLRENGLDPDELLLEITESAYTQDSQQIISTVNHLRNIGFHIEMDDFGTGYSSLNMISTLPIDAMKLDMTFIRNAFKDGGDTRLIEVIIDIADYLRVPVIAEGVETEEQLNALKAMGCDLVQGYYFSKPVPPEEYEPFIVEKKRRLTEPARPAGDERTVDEWIEQEVCAGERSMPGAIARALTTGFEVIYYVDARSGRYVQFSAKGRCEDLKIERSGADFFGESRNNLLSVVYTEDQARVSEALRKPELMRALAGRRTETVVYRRMIAGEPTFYSMKLVMAEDGRHIVIGVSNLMSQVTQGRELDTAAVGRVPFASIAQALAADYFSIYYVDIETDRFIEYSADVNYDSLGIEKEGEDFFDLSRKNILRVVHPDDQDKILSSFTKEKLLSEMAQTGTFTLNYRLMFGDQVNYVAMKATRMMDRNDPHIVIGVNNINAQLERDQEYEQAKRDSVTFASIAQALAADYFSIYYVDTETDRFIEYSADAEYDNLGIEKGGDDFFGVSRRNIERVIHPDDLGKVLSAFTKENLLAEMAQTGTFTLNYRLMFGEKANYVAMKATRMSDQNDPHIVIGVNNINAQMQRQLEYDAARAQSDMYSHIAQSLAREYYSIYLVNTETDEFTEYSSSQNYQELHVEKSGVDFFKECRRNVLRLVYKEDLENAMSVWDKSRLMPELEGGRSFSVTYRLMMDGVPTYINCKVLRMESELGGRYIVVGVSNVDEEMRREQEMSAIREKANRDALTGAKSKHAYVDAVAELNTQIDLGSVQPFSVVVCDVNGLKTVNDTLGHNAGDKLIRDASQLICDTFQHSPVYRVGGDEFVVILRGRDYAQRAALIGQMKERNRRSRLSGGVVIACGASEWRTGEDNRFESVFDRADIAMYENKSALKAGG